MALSISTDAMGEPVWAAPDSGARRQRKKHRVHEPLDTRFRSAARLLQALWREDRNLPIGSYINEDGKRRKLGSRIAEAAGRTGSNFLTPEIAHWRWRLRGRRRHCH